MDNIHSLFSIKDLENLTGIKAHTIRIWEKRYGLLVPNRTESNIRYYDLENLKKLLNIAILNHQGIKISKIATFKSSELENKVRELTSVRNDQEHFVNSLKISMLNFDRNLFEHTYNSLISESSFREVFVHVLIPFLHSIGIEWQSNSLTPAHEHFFSNLLKQKLLINIERVQEVLPKNPEEVYVLFLPDNEIHEFALLFIHYELLLKGYYSVYLGQSVPIDNLYALQKSFNKIKFISYFTVKPDMDQVDAYFHQFENELLNNRNDEFWAAGQRATILQPGHNLKKTTVFKSLEALIGMIK